MLINKKSYNFMKTLIFFAFSRKRSFSIKEISQRTSISSKVLEQVLLDLKNKGILNSKRGPRGGYTLAKDVSGLTLAGVIEMAGQKLCIMPPAGGQKKEIIDEVFLSLGSAIGNYMEKKFDGITVADIVKKIGQRIGEGGLDYMI